MRKIVILDGYTIHPGEAELTLFQQLGDVTLYERTSADETVEHIADAKYIFTDSTYIGAEVMDRCPNLKWIGLLATGLNSVDIAYAKLKGITVCNVPDYGSESVSQHAFALLLHACSHLDHYEKYVKFRQWKEGINVPYWDHPLYCLAGKTMGIFGFGPIGRCSAKTAQAMGMKVLVSTNYPEPAFKSASLKFADTDTVLAGSHVVSLHCALTNKNKGFINEASIAKMKDGVIIVNTARGKLIDEHALAAALKAGKVSFAALDVMASEPPDAANPLLVAKNCLITPHMAWASNDARTRICNIAANNLREYINGNYVNCVTRM